MSHKTKRALAEQVRVACLGAAQAAYEEAGWLGLCQQGRFELAMDAIHQLDLSRFSEADNENK